MKKGWPVKSIGELCILRPPKAEARSRLKDESYVSFLPMEDMGIDLKYPIPSKERMLREVDGSYTYFADGDVLLAKITPCFQNGKLGIAKDLRNGTGFGSSEFFVLRPNPVLNSEYLYYFLSRSIFREEGVLCMGGSVGHQRVPPDFLLSQQIILPSLPEQQRIVSVLDEAFTGLATAQANAEKNLQNARALFESHLQSVFTQRGKGWVKTKLGDVAEFKNGLNFTRQSKGQTLQIVGVGDFQNNAIVPTDALQSVTIDGKLPDDYLIRRDDILTVRSNGSKDLVGRCMLVPEVDGMTSYSGFIIRIRFNTHTISPRFLLRFMKSSETRAQLTRDGGGANISNINQAKLSELPISLPSFSQQVNIADKLDALANETQRLESLYQQKQAALAALKKSLLHQAFTGEL